MLVPFQKRWSPAAYVSFKKFILTTFYGLSPQMTIFGNFLLDF